MRSEEEIRKDRANFGPLTLPKTLDYLSYCYGYTLALETILGLHDKGEKSISTEMKPDEH